MENIYIILCLDTYGSIMEEEGFWEENKWDANPYNKKNGGICGKPEEFFTDPEAKRIYKKRLRYIISRWGYSPNILAFELWNECNAPEEWVKEMARYIKTIDSYGHFVTTSLGYPWGDNFDGFKIWDIEDIDMITLHCYGEGIKSSVIPVLVQKSIEIAERYEKPFIVSEFGIDRARNDRDYDSRGEATALHNGLWSSVMTKSFGTAMNWWWDSYIKPQRLYSHYKALSLFLEGVNWDSDNVEYADVGPVTFNWAEKGETVYRDVSINPVDKWGKAYTNEFTVLGNGDLSGGGSPVKYLHGMAKSEMRSDHTFNAEYPTDGKLIIRVGTVSQGGELHIYLDGEEKLKKEFPAGSGTGPWERSLYLKKRDVYQCVYNRDVGIEVPAGRHKIVLRNTGKDWIGIDKITFVDYADDSRANARCIGLIVGNDMLFWVQNKEFNWKNTFNNIEPKPVRGAFFEVTDISDGEYTVELWDTFKGKVLSEKNIETRDGRLRIELPEFSRDLAYKVRAK